MTRRPVHLLVAAAVSLLAGIGLAVTMGGQPADAASTSPSAVTQFGSCLAGRRSGDVLLLIDESGSLQQTDPANSRVTAAKYLVDRLASYATAGHVRLSVSIAAFADAYRNVLGWTNLTNSSANSVDTSIDSLTTSNTGFDTDYWSALDSSRTQLEKRSSGDSGRCQAVVWFTDGALDIEPRTSSADQRSYGAHKPYSGSLNITSSAAARTAQQGAQQDLCRKGGVADAIRADGIRMFAVGLQGAGKHENFGLLTAIATGRAPDGTTCGAITQPAPGIFERVSDIDSLLFAFDSLSTPGQPGISRDTGICPVTACLQDQHAFVLDASIRTVHILGTSNIHNAAVTLRGPTGRVANLVDRGAGRASSASAGSVRIAYTWVSSETLEIDLTEPRALGWTGRWALVFTNPAGASPKGISRSDIHISSDISATWPGASSHTLRSGEKTGIQLGLVHANGAVVSPASILGTVRLSAALVAASGQTIRQLPPDLSKADLTKPVSLDLAGVQPGPVSLRLTLAITTAPALIDKGHSVPGTALTAQVTDIPLTVRPPLNYPTVQRQLIFGSVTGAAHSSGDLVVTGPGCVWLRGGLGATVLAQPAGIGRVDVTSKSDSQNNCLKVADGKTAKFAVTLTTQRQGHGSLRGTTTVSVAPADSSGPPLTVSVAFTAELQKSLNASKFLVVLLVALLLGLGIPALLLYAFKWLEARIPAGTLFAERVSVTVTPDDTLRDGQPLAMRDRDFVDGVIVVNRGGARGLDALGVHLRTVIAGVPGKLCDVVVDEPSRVGASSSKSTPYDSRLRARLPLAVHNHWVLLHDLTGAPDSAELLVMVSQDAPPAARADLIADARQRVPSLLTRLRADARDRGIPGAGPPEPALVGAAGFPADAEAHRDFGVPGQGFPSSPEFGDGAARAPSRPSAAGPSGNRAAPPAPDAGFGFPSGGGSGSGGFGFPDEPGFPSDPGSP